MAFQIVVTDTLTEVQLKAMATILAVFLRLRERFLRSGGQALQPSLTVGLLTAPVPVSSPRVSKGSGPLRAARHS